MDDEDITKLTKMLEDDISIVQGRMFLLDILPWLTSIMPLSIRNKVFQVDKFDNNRKLFRKLMNVSLQSNVESSSVTT